MTFNDQFPVHPDYLEAVRAHIAALARAKGNLELILAANAAFSAAIEALPDPGKRASKDLREFERHHTRKGAEW